MIQYETVIGLEVHVELSTESKIFCDCAVEFGQAANTLCCPVCTGMPGTLPVMNKKVLEYAILTGLATGCTISEYFKFDRKNYFYPDLPKAYQISQLYMPICKNGAITIDLPDGGGSKKIGIHEIHMEEDAGKLIHDPWEDKTLVDYNRCGVPLLEIVSEPDLRSADEAIAYITKLKSILEYLGVSDCKMQEGSLRADINLSVKPVGTDVLGTRTEMKNMNSLKAIHRAIVVESKRQIEEITSGKIIIQETRRWDENKDSSFSMRTKENAKDYRYFPEPDLLPFSLDRKFLEQISAKIPELADSKKLRYKDEFNLPDLDIDILTSNVKLARLFEKTIEEGFEPKEVSNLIMGDLLKALKDSEIEIDNIKVSSQSFAKSIKFYKDGKINKNSLKLIIAELVKRDFDPGAYISENSLEQISDEGGIEVCVNSVIKENPDAVRDYLDGKEKALSFLMGKVMQQMKGKASPAIVKEMLSKNLKEQNN